MYFLKYRHRFAYGTDHHYEYKELPDNEEETIKEAEEKIEEEFDWSEHYRGIEYEVIEKPPEEWIIDKIGDFYSKIEYCEEKIEEYRKLL